MTRTFSHSFDPASKNPIAGATASLTVQEIEDAGVKEVLQTPGAALGSWALLDALLMPTGSGTPFLFREPLGQAREVKVALSGLFGRFVARAYLERYFGLSVFVHLGKTTLTLSGTKQIKVVRIARGDFPDWVACTASLSNLTVAEAKGCHDAAGPAIALSRAWKQAGRVNVTIGGRRAGVKRVAIATRWGSATGGASNVQLSVKDPEDEGDEVHAEEMDELYLGLLRLHIAGLVGPLGHPALANSLRALATARSSRQKQLATEQANQLLVADSSKSASKLPYELKEPLIGGAITRAGPLANSNLSNDERQTLARLTLRPAFVGVERRLVAAAINHDVTTIRSIKVDQTPDADQDLPRSDSAGTRVVPLGKESNLTGSNSQ